MTNKIPPPPTPASEKAQALEELRAIRQQLAMLCRIVHEFAGAYLQREVSLRRSGGPLWGTPMIFTGGSATGNTAAAVPEFGIECRVSRLRLERYEVHGELTVTCGLGGQGFDDARSARAR